MRYLPLIFALLLPLAACGIDGPPPAGETDGSPKTGGFTPEDF